MNDFQGHGTGALPKTPDWRDYELACIPGVNAMLQAGAPPSFDLRQFWGGPALNQGAEPSCVAFSTCHMMMMFEQMEARQWIPLDGHGLYVANHGDGLHGVDTRGVLQYCSNSGAWALGDQSKRWKIKNFAFVDFRLGTGAIETVKAAVASGRPCVLAWLLPTDFSGNSQGTGVAGLGSYHQTVIAAYSPDRFAGPNSWGPGWGDNGWYSAPWSFLLRPEQAGYVYAYSVEDAMNDGSGPPPPPKPTKATIGAKLTGEGVGQLAVGQVLSVSGGGFTGQQTLTQIAIDTDTDPPPNTLTVTGYSKNTVRPGETFTIMGSGFTGGILTVTWGGVVLAASRTSPNTINAVAPANTGQNPVQVRVEGSVAEGPLLTVSTGDPLPVGDLEVKINDYKRISRTAYIWASATEGGQPVKTTMQLFVNASTVPEQTRDVAAGTQALFGSRAAVGSTFRILATSESGKTGTTSLVL